MKILDLDGTFKKTICVGQDGSSSMFCHPYYLAFGKTSKNLYVSDNGSSVLYCVTLEGKIVYKYEDKEWRGGLGVFVDENDDAFICGRDSCNVQTVSVSGRKHGTFICDKDGIRRPQCVAVRKSDDTVVIGCHSNDKLFSFQLVL